MKFFLCFLSLVVFFAGCSLERESVSTTDSQPSIENFPLSTIDSNIYKIGEINDVEIYKKVVETNKKQLELICGENGIFNSTIETPKTEFFIVDCEGKKLINQKLNDCHIMYEGDWASLNQQYPTLYGSYNGDFYWYTFVDGKFELSETINSGECPSNNDNIEYSKTRYAYDSNYHHILYGINDKNGNVIFDPIFNRIAFPFEDRFILYTNNRDYLDASEGFCALADANKNFFCVFTDINFFHFDNGTYVGIAYYSGYGENWGHILYDNNYTPIEVGHRFIDKYGNELSPCFDLFSICGNEQEFIDTYFDEPVTVLSRSGKEMTLSIKDYICKP